MKALFLIFIAILMTGCANMSETEKRVVTVIATAVVVGAIVSSQDSSSSSGNNCHWVVTPSGSTQVCR